MDKYTLMEDMQVDIYGFAETNVAWNPMIMSKMHSQLRINARGGNSQVKMVASSCEDPTLGIYQPGGVCMVALNKIVGRMEKYGKDPSGLGRWTYMTLQGRKGRKVVIVTSYRLSQNSQPDGYRTAYNQQYRVLRRQGISKPEPKIQFCKDLLQQIDKWKTDSEVIVMADANGDMEDKD